MIVGIKKTFACVEGSNGVGKTTVLKLLADKYQLKISKSVPEWFRGYISDVRALCPKQEYKLYEAAHITEILKKPNHSIYFYDRSIYSTVIRIFYKNKKKINEVLNFISELEIVPELVLVFQCERSICYSRIKERNDNIFFDNSFFEYENAVYDLMIKEMDNCCRINAAQDYLLVANEVYQCILQKFGEIL
ncbi:hypothetical protein D7X87_24300 [bacterium D16-54]|nr:hypothetical protein D7X87_24300 [bacterium D16-54]RKJ09772.1 hypothetical protein D7X65_24675 [bacterium D16-56]